MRVPDKPEGMKMDMTSACATEAQRPAPSLAIVVPCYNEQEVLPETLRRLGDLLSREERAGRVAPASALILVDDGSTDRTWSIIGVAHAADRHVCGVKLSHNRGHQSALVAGLTAAHEAGFDCMVTIDADLQDDVEAIDAMLAKHARGSDVVYGVRDDRETDSAFKRGSAEAFYGLMRALGVEMVSDAADFRLMSRRAVAALLEYREANLFLRGIVPSIGFPSSRVYYARAPRFAGRSKYPLGKMVGLALDGITSFSIKPIRLVTAAGFAFVLVGMVMLVYALAVHRHGLAVPGWTSLMVTMWVVGGAIMLSLGIVGEYVGRIYLETKHRPRFIVEERLGLGGGAAAGGAAEEGRAVGGQRFSGEARVAAAAHPAVEEHPADDEHPAASRREPRGDR